MHKMATNETDCQQQQRNHNETSKYDVKLQNIGVCWWCRREIKILRAFPPTTKEAKSFRCRHTPPAKAVVVVVVVAAVASSKQEAKQGLGLWRRRALRRKKPAPSVCGTGSPTVCGTGGPFACGRGAPFGFESKTGENLFGTEPGGKESGSRTTCGHDSLG